MRLLRLSSLLLMLALAGCATTVSTPTPEQQAQGQHARQLYADGQYAQAAQAWQQLAAQNRSSGDHYRLRAAEAWHAAEATSQTSRMLGRIDPGRLSANDIRHYNLLEAEIALEQGNAARALDLTRQPSDGLPDPLRRRTLDVRAQALADTNHPWQAAQTRAKLNPMLADGDRAANSQQILQLLSGIDAATLQQHAQSLPPEAPLRRWVAEALSRMGISVARAAPSLTRAVGTMMPGADQAEGFVMPQQVALLLPATGSPGLVAAAKAIREGFFAAYFQAGRSDAVLPPVKVYDTTGAPAAAVAAYRQAVGNGATLVIGPLTRASVGAIAQQADLPVPVLALNHPDSNSLPPPHMTEFALRPETEGAQVARHMLQRGLHRAAMVVSSESFAQRAAKAFRAQFEGSGGQVTTMLTLSPSQVDYASQLGRLDLTGSADTGIFISMRPQQARLLMPQMRLAGIDAPVFATSHVYAGTTDAIADNDLDGIVFCDAPWLFNTQSGLPPRRAMASRLPTARGASARLFAFGMDAWSLAPYLGWLRSHTGSYLAGASGRLSEDDFGQIHRTMTWASFSNGVAHPLAGNLDIGAPITPVPTAQPATPATTAEPASPAAPPAPTGSSATQTGG